MDGMEFAVAKRSSWRCETMSAHRDALKLAPEVILIAYYSGAYGPTLRIDTQSTDRLNDLIRLTARFAEGSVVTAPISQVGNIFIEPPIHSLDLVTGHSDVADLMPSTRADVPKALSCSHTRDGGMSLVWTQTRLGWIRVRGLIEGLLMPGRFGVSGHQYLTDIDSDEILLEVSYRE
jgi:hypothetical protein